MAEIFISYRRDDQPGFAGRLADSLGLAFGADNVFRDIEDIHPGEDFVAAIAQQLRTVDVLLVMIGPAWLGASRNGVRRLDEAGDFVSLEIQAGLASGKPVIPVLVGGATMPAEADLPPALAGLARRQAVILSDIGWAGDVARLVDSLHALLPASGPSPRKARPGWLIPVGVALLVLLAVALAPRFLPEQSSAARPAARLSAADIAGRWTARVKYDWGDAYDEVFEFNDPGGRLHGSATYLGGRLSIEQASLDDGWLRFVTRSRETLGSDSVGKEVTHRYTGQLVPEGIRFTLESGGGYSIHPPLEFIAARVKP